MKNIACFLILILSISTTVFGEEIPILVLHQDKGSDQSTIEKVNVSEADYSSFLNKSLKRALKKKQLNRFSNNFELNYIVIGMSTDVRVGFFSWNLSTSAAVEYHLKVVSDD
jgi:hypothetical protein